MAAERSSFMTTLVDSEGYVCKVHSSKMELERDDNEENDTLYSSDSRKGLYYAEDLTSWRKYFIQIAVDDLPLTEPILIVVDLEGV